MLPALPRVAHALTMHAAIFSSLSPRILLPPSNNPFALNARRNCIPLAGRTRSCLVPLPTAPRGSDILLLYMKPENKMVAAVVVLGVVIVTAAAVVMNSPRWRQKAKKQHQESVLRGMTPEAIALCGHPVLDETQTNQPTVTRRLVIRNDYALAVELDFAASTAEPQKWRLTGIQDPSGEIKYQTPASQIGVLPCLDAKPVRNPNQKQQ